MISLIAAVGLNNELGKNGDLVFRYKADMQFFQKMTMGHTVVMGRKTWDSLPKKLDGRVNLVVSAAPVDDADGTIHHLDEYLELHKDDEEEIFIIGGGSVYAQALPYAKNIYLTEIARTADADVFFPTFDKNLYKITIIEDNSNGGKPYVIKKYSLGE